MKDSVRSYIYNYERISLALECSHTKNPSSIFVLLSVCNPLKFVSRKQLYPKWILVLQKRHFDYYHHRQEKNVYFIYFFTSHAQFLMKIWLSLIACRKFTLWLKKDNIVQYRIVSVFLVRSVTSNALINCSYCNKMLTLFGAWLLLNFSPMLVRALW